MSPDSHMKLYFCELLKSKYPLPAFEYQDSVIKTLNLYNFHGVLMWKKFIRGKQREIFMTIFIMELKDFLWELIALIYGNLICLKNWEISSDKIIELTLRFLNGRWFWWVLNCIVWKKKTNHSERNYPFESCSLFS